MKSCKDHLGNKYRSISEMCSVYGISYAVYSNRMKSGKTLEETLTTPCIASYRLKLRTDHFGRVYGTVKEMCEHYGIPVSVYYNRVRRGLPIEKCLAKYRVANCQRRHVDDDCGHVFTSMGELCNFYHLDLESLKSRLRHGEKLKDILQPYNMF